MKQVIKISLYMFRSTTKVIILLYVVLMIIFTHGMVNA
jgi:hypothetical protein